jgi:putative membrane protein
MPFTDYLSLMLTNMAAGLLVLAFFFLRGYGTPNERSWAAGLAAPGLVALVTGLHMTLTWPIRMEQGGIAWADSAFGETTVLMGIAFLAASLTVSRGWSLVPVTIYAAVAGVIAIVLGIRIGMLGLTAAPAMSSVGFILTGLAGPLTLAVALSRGQKVLKGLTVTVLLASGALWLFTACMAYWGHLEMWAKKAGA